MLLSRSNPLWQHFEEFDNARVKCKKCGNIYQDHLTNARRHLIAMHGISEEEDRLKWKNDTYLFWKHFSRGDPFEARCKLCSTLIISAFRQDIEYHLNKYHQEEVAKIQIEITSNSELSQHFNFEDSYATCKLHYCNYKVKIYEGINVLKCHWRSHEVQHSVHEENYAGPSSHCDNTYWPPLGYPEGYPMIQHSVDVRNYAGPSSYCDNYTYWSPALGYPEGYRMIQNSADVGNYPGPSSYCNNLHLNSLGNEGGQQGYFLPHPFRQCRPVTSISMSDYVMAPSVERQSHEPLHTSFQSFKPAIEDIGTPYKSNYSGQQGSTSYNTPSDYDDFPDWVYM